MNIRNRFRWLAACASLAALAPAHGFRYPSTSTAFEYQNDITGHYLLLSSAEELAYVDRGLAGPGWGRTGYYFHSYTFNPGIADLAPKPVCRFYSAINNSHFFTVSTAECEILKQPGTGWAYEKFAFSMEVPGASGCAAGRIPVYRLYNNRHAEHDANHRYTAEGAVRAAMRAAGWADEGVAFCGIGAGTAPEATLDLLAPGNALVPVSAATECELRLGTCVGLSKLAPMPNSVASWLPPFYVTKNPGFPWDLIGGFTGVDLAIWTSLPPGSHDLLNRSFVQVHNSPVGVYIRGADRTGGVYAGASPMRVLPGGSSDERVFPWRGTRDRTLVVSADISVPRIRRSNGAAHAYGHPLLEFVDQVSGRKFYVTLQAFGTLPAGDYVGPDATTGWAIVSTSFRANPLFGKRLVGEYVQCDPGSAMPCIAARTPFKFAIDRAAFQAVLERARIVDPALSPNVADFFLASFRLHNETYLDAELGMALHRMWLEIYAAGAPS